MTTIGAPKMAVFITSSPSDPVLLSCSIEGREMYGCANLRDDRDTASSRQLGFFSWFSFQVTIWGHMTPPRTAY